MRMVFLDESTICLNQDIDYSGFHKLGEFETFETTNSVEQVVMRANNASHLIVNKVQITDYVMNALPELKQICVVATGYNNIDLESARRHGVTVCNVAGYAKSCVPQHVFALLLNLATKIHLYDQDVKKNGEWQASPHFTLLKYPTFELAGKTIGIIGFGTIGQEVARLAEAFGMKVMMNRQSGKSLGKYPSSSLVDIYQNADVISLNCPLTEENRYMIDQSVFAKMKKSAILINTARGPLVNQQHLADALNTGVIAGAGIDVLDEEPPKDNPLLGDVKHLVLSPHSAWSTLEARQRLIDETVLNIEAWTRGEQRNVIV